jgi:hypothetical protein
VSLATPAEVAIAMRSLPSRVRAAFAPSDDDRVGVDELASPSALAIADGVCAQLRTAARWVDAIVTHDEPDLEVPPAPAAVRTVSAAVAAVDAASSDLARHIDAVATIDWARKGTLPDGSMASAHAVVADAATRAGMAIRDIEGAMQAARH